MSNSGDLPSELRAFLFSCIESVEQVEILMRLHGSERAWTAREVGNGIQIADAAARAHLETLAARGLLRVSVDQETTYRYEPNSQKLRECGALLSEYYLTSRSAVLGFVAARSRAGMRTFIDAFKLRDPEA